MRQRRGGKPSQPPRPRAPASRQQRKVWDTPRPAIKTAAAAEPQTSPSRRQRKGENAEPATEAADSTEPQASSSRRQTKGCGEHRSQPKAASNAEPQASPSHRQRKGAGSTATQPPRPQATHQAASSTKPQATEGARNTEANHHDLRQRQAASPTKPRKAPETPKPTTKTAGNTRTASSTEPRGNGRSEQHRAANHQTLRQHEPQTTERGGTEPAPPSAATPSRTTPRSWVGAAAWSAGAVAGLSQVALSTAHIPRTGGRKCVRDSWSPPVTAG